MDILRIEQGTHRKVTLHLQQDGTPVDPDSNQLTITVTNDQGVTLDSENATRDSMGVYHFTLTPTETGTLDLLTLTWEGLIGGVAYVSRSIVEIVSGYMFTVPQARVFPELAGFTDEQIIAARTNAEEFLEWQCRRGFVTHYRRDDFPAPYPTFSDLPRNPMQTGAPVTVSGFRPAPGMLMLSRPFVTAIRSVTANGTPLTNDELATLTLNPSGVLGRTGAWAYPVRVEYEHGRQVPDGDRVCLILARHRLLNSPIDDRATGLPDEGGGVISLLTPGVKGSITGIPEVDAWIAQNSYANLGDPIHGIAGVPAVSA